MKPKVNMVRKTGGWELIRQCFVQHLKICRVAA
jgi:hypothetical protein